MNVSFGVAHRHRCPSRRGLDVCDAYGASTCGALGCGRDENGGACGRLSSVVHLDFCRRQNRLHHACRTHYYQWLQMRHPLAFAPMPRSSIGAAERDNDAEMRTAQTHGSVPLLARDADFAKSDLATTLTSPRLRRSFSCRALRSSRVSPPWCCRSCSFSLSAAFCTSLRLVSAASLETNLQHRPQSD